MIGLIEFFQKRTVFAVVALLFLGASCGERLKIDQADWIVGTWEMQTRTRTIYESWERESDYLFVGQSYRLANGDTLLLERIQLVQEGEELYFLPTVTDQNDGQTITFSLRSIDSKGWVFECPEHDYPQRIAYQRVSRDSLVATISGTRDGELQERTYGMKRVATH